MNIRDKIGMFQQNWNWQLHLELQIFPEEVLRLLFSLVNIQLTQVDIKMCW
jgi:hypothetical protein